MKKLMNIALALVLTGCVTVTPNEPDDLLEPGDRRELEVLWVEMSLAEQDAMCIRWTTEGPDAVYQTASEMEDLDQEAEKDMATSFMIFLTEKCGPWDGE